MDFNTIKIKAGSGIPGPDVLSERELGWDKENKHLYIGTEDGPYQINFSQNQEDTVDYLPLSGGIITGDLTIEGATTANNLTIEGTLDFPNGSPFAPSGYGLGRAVYKNWSEVDSVVAPGWYHFSADKEINVGGASYNYAYMYVSAYGNGNLHARQMLYPVSSSGYIVTRIKHSGDWGEWEWFNPPMYLDIEYRTTERYDNKAVYKKRDSVGNLFWRVDGETTWRKDGSVPLDSMPVGYVYISFTATSPGELFGGDWERIQDTFLLAAGSTYAIDTNGGEATHTLTVDEIPSHNHSVTATSATTSGSASALEHYGTRTADRSFSTGSKGGNQAHNNMPPYITVYIWKRVA